MSTTTLLRKSTTHQVYISRIFHSSRPSPSRFFSTSPLLNMAAKVSPLSSPLPPGTWDSHMHVVDPTRFPLSAKAKYTPSPHTMEDACAFYGQLDIQNLVLVQPSIYGTDNSCMLEALRELTPKHGRAVVELDPAAVTQDTLREWHGLGVRGVRVNLVSVGRDLDGDELQRELQAYADCIRPWGWVLQLYIPMKLAATLETIAAALDVKLCVDHFGSPPLSKLYDPTKAVDPYSFDGFASLVSLLKQGRTWVKLSAPYRITQDPGLMRDLDAIGRELIKRAPDQVVYATDWPHTRFDDVDSTPFIEMCYSWCGEGTGLREKLFRDNAEVLFDVQREQS